ncbi:MAG TPA: hypothetical protein PKL31_03155 [Fulvivirga sp.]|nr:hypothetical protein [Fulvivirga sp.]
MEICKYYYDTVNNNIRHFHKNKTNKKEMVFENIADDFEVFWKMISAKGSLSNSLDTLKVVHNASE